MDIEMNELKGVNVLVVGGNGFIGSHLCRRLLKENANVSTFIKKDKKNIEDIAEKIDIYKINITDPENVKKEIKEINPGKIFNVAAITSVERSLDAIDGMIDINLKGNLNIIKALNKECDCVINVGTIEEYGINKAPFHEDKTIPEPVSPYSASKSSLTMFSKMLYNSFKIPIVILRPSKVYGPNGSVNLSLNQSLITKLIICGLLKKEFNLSGGNQYRDFMYIDDAVEGFIKASLTKEAIGETINLGSGKGYIIKDIVKKIIDNLGDININYSEQYRKGENMEFYNSNEKAKRLLNWTPKISIDEGLKMTIEWYKDKYNNGDLKRWIIQD